MVTGVNLWLLGTTVALLPLLVPRGPAQSAPVDAVALLYMLLALVGLSQRGRAARLPARGPLGLVLVASLVATVFGLSVSNGLLSLLVEAYLVLLFVCVANDLDGDRHALRVVLVAWSIAALVWATLFVGFHHELLPPGLQGLLAENARGGERVAGASGNPNLAASYMMTSFFVALASPWPRHRLVRLGAAGWLFAGLWVTGSNGALLGLAAGTVTMAVATSIRSGTTPSQRLGVVGVALLGGVMAVTAAVLAVGVPRVEVRDLQAVARHERGGVLGGSLGRLDRSVTGRLTIWSQAWAGAGSRALVGVGPGSAPKIPLGAGSLHRGLHSDYLAFLVERGLLGLLGLLGLCAALLRWAGRLLVAGSTEHRWRLAGLGGAVVANLVLATNHESFHFRHLWVLLGLVWAAYLLVGRQAASTARSRPEPVSTERELAHAGR
jgi:O-antigen ligase